MFQVLEVGNAVDPHFLICQELDSDRGQHRLCEESPLKSLGKGRVQRKRGETGKHGSWAVSKKPRPLQPVQEDGHRASESGQRWVTSPRA